MQFIEQFRAARRVSTPIIAIRTFDSNSTVRAIRNSLGEKVSKTPLVQWDSVNGLRPLNDAGNTELTNLLNPKKEVSFPQEATVSLSETLRLAQFRGETLVTSNKEVDSLIFVTNAQFSLTEPTIIQGIWNLRDIYKSIHCMLVLLISPGTILPTELTHDVLVLEEPLLTIQDLQKIVKDTYKFAKLQEPTEETVNKATDALIGLPAFPAEQATAMCLNVKASTLDILELWERKRQIVSQTPGLSVWNGPEKMEDIGGIKAAKDFFTRVVNGNDAPKTIIFLDEIEKAFAGTGTDTSGVKTELTGSMLSWMQDKEIDGSILIGIPGVAKSALAKGLGGTYGIPVINFDLAGMQSSLVGSSGANLRSAQKTVDAISGGRVLAIATCNSINALPPELRRRFNLGIFFFDQPTQEERSAIWKIYRAKYKIDSSEVEPDSTGWTGAEIKECCKKAYRLRMTLQDAAQYIVPVTTSSADRIESLRHQSSGKYLSASLAGIYYSHESKREADASNLQVVETGRSFRGE